MGGLDPPRLCGDRARSQDLPLQVASTRSGRFGTAYSSDLSDPCAFGYRPEHVLATLYRHLGIDTQATFFDNAGRPRYVLERRELIPELV